MNIRQTETQNRKKIAVYCPYFAGGGAEAVGLWILEALKEKYDLTLFTASDVDFGKLNSMYETKLSNESVRVNSLVPASLKEISNLLIANNAGFRKLFIHLTIRHLKANQDDYDLILSAYNATDLGKKGIQYIHWINVIEGNAFFHKVSDFSEEQIKSNISISNSQRTANAVKNTYGIDSIVVYPPVVINQPDIPWEEKENAFICSGRLTEAKAPHRVIRILQSVRKQGFDIKLYITGGGGGAYAWKYKRFLKKMVAENSDWVKLCENLSYKEYIEVLAKCKYGIHFKQEPFGISVAEMVKIGAIPFVKNKGGQIEIIGQQNKELFFSSEQEAVERITDVLSEPGKQKKLLEALNSRRIIFSTEKFISEIRKIVENYFENP